MPEQLFPTEDDLQIAVAEFLRIACPIGGEVMWWHTPNGGKRAKKTAKRLKRMGTLAGVADLIFIWRNDYKLLGLTLPFKLPCVAFIELKRLPTTKLKGAQLLFQNWCKWLLIHHAICWSPEGVESTLRNWGVPIKATLQHKL